MKLPRKSRNWCELRRMAEEFTAEIETLQDSIKEEMNAQGAGDATGDD